MAELIFWSSFFVIIYTYFGYISLCVILGLLFGKKTLKKDIFPYISVIVPCYNEENLIGKKIENLMSLEYPKEKIQIIIASESTDKTNNIVRQFKERNIELYAYNTRRGKTVLIYNVMPYVKGEIIVFSDANVLLKKDAINKIARNFYEPRVAAVTGNLVVTNPESSTISKGEYIYKRYESALRQSNSRLKRVLNPDGALFAIRKIIYKPINAERGDDLELVIRVLINGYHSVFEPEAIAYENASVTSKEETTRKVRMISWFLKSTVTLLMEMFLRLRFELIFQIISHKLLRWFTPYFFMALLFSNVFLWKENVFYRIIFVTQLVLLLLGLFGWYIAETLKKKPPLLMGIMYYFLVYNYAFCIGLIKGILPGKASPFWEKARV